ncbi:MAG: undecaprenyl-diphosphate phosphatase [Pirellulaceae bacterium]|nr:undecaprenyl-diphosphate phosphatase [Pirellulaceae bacterium]
MSDHLKALIIGIVEGLTEFLPVSSTAHIRICQELLNISLEDSYWKMFAIVIQLGAVLAVVVYFRYRILDFLRHFPGGRSGQRKWWNHPLSLVTLSFVVTAIPCFLLDKYIGDNLENFHVIGAALIIGGVLMLWIDRTFSQRATTHHMDDITVPQALVIGCTQILAAAFPGVSRSMSTIAGGQVMGLSRPAALEFSFFLSLPVMLAATGFKLLQFVLKSITTITTDQWLILGNGFVVSFLVGWAVIAWFMSWVNRHGFAPFAVYRLVIGSAVLLWLA